MVTSTMQAAALKTPVRAGRIRVLVVDRHQLMIDILGAWLLANAPDIVVEAGLREIPCQSITDQSIPGPKTLPLSPAYQDAGVAVLGTLDHRSGLVPAVQALIAAGLPVVVLSTTLDGMEAAMALAAGAAGYVPKAAGPEHLEQAIRAAFAGRRYVHPDAEAAMANADAMRVKLTPREQKLVELYLGSSALSIRGVSDALGISEQTVKAHLHRIRQRYAAAGIKVGNVISLRRQLCDDGWID